MFKKTTEISLALAEHWHANSLIAKEGKYLLPYLKGEFETSPYAHRFKLPSDSVTLDKLKKEVDKFLKLEQKQEYNKTADNQVEIRTPMSLDFLEEDGVFMGVFWADVSAKESINVKIARERDEKKAR